MSPFDLVPRLSALQRRALPQLSHTLMGAAVLTSKPRAQTRPLSLGLPCLMTLN
jgi:hypothetical protein